MSYNNDGGCCGGGGFSMPFAFTMPWGNGNDGGFGGANGMFGWLMSILFFSLFGFGGWGGGFGGRGMPGMFPGMGMMPGAMGGNVAAETAALVGAQNTADKVSSISTGVDAVAGIATANGVKIETVKDQNAAGFAGLNTHLCEGFNNVAQQFNAQTMQGMNMHSATTALLNDMRAEQAKCCCESKTLAQAIASQQQYQAATDKCEILRAIEGAVQSQKDSEARIVARMDAAEKAALQEKLAKANAIIATQKAEADNQKQTAQLAALIQQQQPRGCAPCAPYGGYGACNPCGNPCLDGLTRAVTDAFGNRISEILFPPTTTAGAA